MMDSTTQWLVEAFLPSQETWLKFGPPHGTEAAAIAARDDAASRHGGWRFRVVQAHIA